MTVPRSLPKARASAPRRLRQVLDRFHLLRNLSAALRAIAVDYHAVLRAVSRALLDQEVKAVQTRIRAVRTPTASEIRMRATHARRQARHAELKRLAEGGASVSGMARALGLDRKTVRIWLARDAPPSWRRRRAVPMILDPYRADLEARWQAACHNAAELTRALIRAGADVHPRVVRDWAMKRRRETLDGLDAVPGSPNAPEWRPPSAKRSAQLLQADPSTMGEMDQRFLDGPRAEAPVLVKSAVLPNRFADLVRRRWRVSPPGFSTRWRHCEAQPQHPW